MGFWLQIFGIRADVSLFQRMGFGSRPLTVFTQGAKHAKKLTTNNQPPTTDFSTMEDMARPSAAANTASHPFAALTQDTKKQKLMTVNLCDLCAFV